MPEMTLNVSEDLNEYLTKQAASRGLLSAVDCVQDCLESEQLEDARNWLRAAIQKGIDSGPSTPVTPEFWQELRDRIGKSQD